LGLFGLFGHGKQNKNHKKKGRGLSDIDIIDITRMR